KELPDLAPGPDVRVLAEKLLVLREEGVRASEPAHRVPVPTRQGVGVVKGNASVAKGLDQGLELARARGEEKRALAVRSMVERATDEHLLVHALEGQGEPLDHALLVARVVDQVLAILDTPDPGLRVAVDRGGD